MSKIKFIYFDFGGVLAHWKPAVAQMAQHLNSTEKDVFVALYEHFSAAGTGHISTNEMWSRIKKAVGSSHEHDSYAELFTQYFIPINETHALVSELKRDYRVGILSNIEPEVLDISRRRGYAGDAEYDVVIESHEAGYLKPQEEIFQIATTRAGHAPEEIFFTDDLLPNIEAAREAGWHAVQFDPEDPDASIRAIRDYLRNH